MKLSEAILLGSMLRPQGHGWLFKDGKSRAIGSALEASGTPYQEYLAGEGGSLYKEAIKKFPNLITLEYEITNKNDFGWSRERIAEWVTVFEYSEDVVKKPVQELEVVAV